MPIEHDEWAERCKCDKCVWQRVQKLIADGKRGREVEFAIILGIRGKLQQIDRLMACPSGAIAPAEVEGVTFRAPRQIDWQADGELKQSASWFALAYIRETLVHA